MKFTAQPASQIREIPTIEFFCRPGIMCTAFAPTGILSMSNSKSCMLARTWFAVVPTKMELFVVIMLWAGSDGVRYIYVAPYSAIPELPLLTIF